MVVCTETPKLYLLGILDLLGIAVTPFYRNIGVGVGIHKDVEGAIAIQNGEEGDRGCNLAENSLDLLLNLFFSLLDRLDSLRLRISVEQGLMN